MKKRVLRIPLVPLILIICLILFITIGTIGTQIIKNSAMYKQANTAMSVDGKYEYEELEDGTIEITEYSGTERAITIPAQIDGKKVKGIGEYAFDENTILRNIKISNGIEYIGYGAFGDCYNVRRIEIPESIIDISSAFWNCTNLKEIKVDSSNKNFVSEDGILFNKEKTEILKYPSGKTNEEYIIPNGGNNNRGRCILWSL